VLGFDATLAAACARLGAAFVEAGENVLQGSDSEFCSGKLAVPTTRKPQAETSTPLDKGIRRRLRDIAFEWSSALRQSARAGWKALQRCSRTGKDEMALAALTREQMLERCDLAGVARVVSVGRASPHSPNVARLAFLRVVKGELREAGGFVDVRLHGGGPARREGGLSAWSDWWDYPVGATVMTHLDWNGADEIYQTTWPGAVSEIDDDMAEVA